MLTLRIDNDLIQKFMDEQASFLRETYSLKKVRISPPYIKFDYIKKVGFADVKVPVVVEITATGTSAFLHFHVKIPLLEQPVSKYVSGIIVDRLDEIGIYASSHGGTVEIPLFSDHLLDISIEEEDTNIIIKSVSE